MPHEANNYTWKTSTISPTASTSSTGEGIEKINTTWWQDADAEHTELQSVEMISRCAPTLLTWYNAAGRTDTAIESSDNAFGGRMNYRSND